MEIRRLPADRDAVRRYVEELWLPYHRDLEATVDGSRDGSQTDDENLAGVDEELTGFITTNVDESPPVFDRPDRLIVGE